MAFSGRLLECQQVFVGLAIFQGHRMFQLALWLHRDQNAQSVIPFLLLHRNAFETLLQVKGYTGEVTFVKGNGVTLLKQELPYRRKKARKVFITFR
jgi:hypothetical protein